MARRTPSTASSITPDRGSEVRCPWWCARSSPGARSEGASASWSTSSSSSTRRSRSSSSPRRSTSPTSSTGTGSPTSPARDCQRSTPGSMCCGPASGCRELVGPFADRSLERQVLDAVDELGLHRPLLWINDASYAALAVRTGWPSLYDITDDWLLAPLAPRQRDRLMADEGLLLEHSQEVVVCSPDAAPVPGAPPSRRAHPQRGGRRALPHPPTPARGPASGPGRPLRRDTAHLAHRHPARARAGRGPARTSRSCWSGPNSLPRDVTDRVWSGSRTSMCSGPVPTTGSRPTCSMPTWSSSPTWSTRSPRASTRSRPTSAWPPAGPRGHPGRRLP